MSTRVFCGVETRERVAGERRRNSANRHLVFPRPRVIEYRSEILWKRLNPWGFDLAGSQEGRNQGINDRWDHPVSNENSCFADRWRRNQDCHKCFRVVNKIKTDGICGLESLAREDCKIFDFILDSKNNKNYLIYLYQRYLYSYLYPWIRIRFSYYISLFVCLVIVRQYLILSEVIRSDIIRFYLNTYPKKFIIYFFYIHYICN
jgi:hypothetical protein